MIKEFEINDILNAVNKIYKIERKKDKTLEAQSEFFALGEQEKSNKSKILVLDQMIE